MKKMMNNNKTYIDSKSILSKITKPSFFLRVSENHPLELRLGLDSQNRKTLRLIGSYTRKKFNKTQNLAIQYFRIENSDQIAVDFSLINDEFNDIFYYFCDDLINSSNEITNVNYGLDFILDRYNKWLVFTKNTFIKLSDSSIKGLIGELLFLIEAFQIYNSQTTAISAWTGTEPTKKDFTFHDYWFEIKTSTNNEVTISSFNQLTSLHNYPGMLVVFILEKLSPIGQGVTLNKLTENILSKIELQSDRTNFILKLIDAGYSKHEYYDDFVYQVLDANIININEDFPMLHRAAIDPRIIDVKYSIDVSTLNKIKLGEFKR